MENSQSIFKYFSNILFGDKNTFSLEKRVFIAASLISLLGAITGLIWDLVLHLPIILNIVVGIFIIFYFLFYFFSRFGNRYSPILFAFVSLAFLTSLYITNSGINGSIPPLFIVFLVVFIGISNPKHQLLILIVTVTNLLALIIAEKFFLKEIIVQYSNIETKEMDISFGYVACLIISYFLLSFYKKSYTSKNAELQQSNANKDMLFRIIAHDLSAPINNVLGFTDLMTDKTESLSLGEFQKYSEIANKESIKASELLQSLLEWGEIQMNRVKINPQAVNLNQISEEIIKIFKNKWIEKEIEINIQIPKEIYAFTDVILLKTILRNLVSNAIKFTPRGGTIVISTEDFDRKYITINVKDNGIGMNKEMIDNLFHLQITTNRAGTEGEASNGLGLIITKELIEQQGGKLRIESQINLGSTFKFTVLKSNKNIN